jgi:hypothetical protein
MDEFQCEVLGCPSSSPTAFNDLVLCDNREVMGEDGKTYKLTPKICFHRKFKTKKNYRRGKSNG